MSQASLEGWPANAVTLAAVFVVTFGAAALGGLAAGDSAGFYHSLRQPSWAPSPAVFGPVWTVLYSLMAISAYLVVREVGWRAALLPLALYASQLLLNAAWTWLFFAWRSGGVAFAEIVVLAVLVAANVFVFWRIKPVAGVLLLPYLGWVCFAAVLTMTLWRSNPDML